MNKKGFATVAFIVLILGLGVVAWLGCATLVKKPSVQSGAQLNVPQAPISNDVLQENSNADVSNLQFSYDNDVFELQKRTSESGVITYNKDIGVGTPNGHYYTFMANDPTVYAQGTLNGVDTKSIVLWRGSGANIIEGIVFVFQKNGSAWKQVAYAQLPPDGGRTTIEKLSLENDTIAMNVKTSGPDRNYHETYVPKTYVYVLNGTTLTLR